MPKLLNSIYVILKSEDKGYVYWEIFSLEMFEYGRTKEIHSKKCRLTEQENLRLCVKMGHAHAPSFQYYARKMCLEGKVMRVDYGAIRDLTREVHKIGVNINQMAHTLHITGNFYGEELEILKAEHEELCRLIRNGIRAHLRTIRLEEDL